MQHLAHQDVIVSATIDLGHHLSQAFFSDSCVDINLQSPHPTVDETETINITPSFVNRHSCFGQYFDPAILAMIVRLGVHHLCASAYMDVSVHHVLQLDRVGKGTVSQKLHLGPSANIVAGNDLLPPLSRQHAKT